MNNLYQSNIQLTSIPLKNDPIKYVAGEELIKAVEIAIALGKPLVVSGEPGTGKTQLAHFVAAQLHSQTKNDAVPFAEKALEFFTKSTSSANDLFYYYDAVAHFQNKEQRPASDFISLGPMGLAIAAAHGKGSDGLECISTLREFNTLRQAPVSSVVLIDEIDKAPRDFPNDLLNEMENYSFHIKELNRTVRKAKNDAKIIVIMTSNSEKNLPNAFLRRCVFYHIEFPGKEKLLEITKRRMQIDDGQYDEAILKAIDEFRKIREGAVNKKPATSEFLDWMNILRHYNLLNNKIGENHQEKKQQENYESSLSTLLKSKEDIEKFIKK